MVGTHTEAALATESVAPLAMAGALIIATDRVASTVTVGVGESTKARPTLATIAKGNSSINTT